MNFREEVENLRKRENMINPGDKIVVGFSGGADSVFMTELLLACREKLDFSLILVHVNHMLRGEEANGDEAFSAEYAETRGLPFFSLKADVRALARKEKLSVETAGRNVRRAFYREILQKEQADKIALAHNRDDQIENFLFRLIRGASLAGLEGIPSGNGIIRPVSHIGKKEILRYLTEAHIPWREDRTNEDVAYTRNSIRRELIP
ncbi:MAG: tRNA lysidine(34) synthetase TilS, partial [Fusobacteriaceae bacterium]|nr:tRNA lysidine(34) synthetase TilS [Fusobacteriaceae bacterium]